MLFPDQNYNYGAAKLFMNPTQWSVQTGIKIMVPQNYFQILHYAISRPELKLWYQKTISKSYTMVCSDQNYNYGTAKPFPISTLWSFQTRIKIMVQQNYFQILHHALSRIIIMVPQNHFWVLHYAFYS